MTTMTAAQPGATSIARAGKYLTFQLGTEIFGIEILKVQEILGILPVTKVPRTPDFVRGVINLRGKVIPVLDLRSKFDLPRQEDGKRTCIIVAQIESDNGMMIMGVIVDEVSEVLNIQPDQIENAPHFGEGIHTDFILGMGKVGQKVVMLLDVDKVLSATELKTLETVNSKESTPTPHSAA